jgi:hypothetical protein
VAKRRASPAPGVSAPTDQTLQREHLRAGLLFALFVLIYLWPVLLGGKVLSPVELLSTYAPWKGISGPGAADLVNPALFDVPTSFQPWRELARDLVHSGTFPAWNPHALAGTPLFGNPEVAWLSPFTLLGWLLPLNWSLGLAAAIKLWAAGFGTYLLARELKLSFWPGMLAGVSFALCAFNVVWLAHGVHVSVAMTLPWLILLIERIVRRGSPGTGWLLAVVAALAFSGGHPATQLHVMSAAAIYALLRVFAGQLELTSRERWTRLGLVTAGLAVGALLLAVTLVPGWHDADGTIGAQVRTHGGPTLPGSTLQATALRSALFPDWWGRPQDGQFDGPANYNERTFYAGAVALLLAIFGLIASGGWRRKLPFVVIGALGLTVPINLPGLHWLTTHLPLYAATQNQRMLLLFMFATAVLAAFGLQALIDRPREQGDAWRMVAAAAGVGVIGMVALGPTGSDVVSALGSVVGDLGQARQDTPGLTSVWCWLIAVGGIAGALLVLRARPQAVLAVAGCLVALAALDMLHFADRYQPMVPSDRATPPRTNAIRYLEQHAGTQRIAGVSLALPPDVPTLYGLHDARGYDAPQPSLRFFRLWQLASPRQEGWQPLDVRQLSPTALNVLSLLGARLIMLEPSDTSQLLGVRQVYTGPDAKVVRNPRALPRAFVAPSVRVVADERAALALIAGVGFDPRRTAIVERGTAGVVDPGR